MKVMLLALALVAAGAQADEESTPCDNVETPQQSFDCSVYNKTTADRELNVAYTDLLARAKSQYSDRQTQLNDYSARIKAAQELWGKLRDADCAVETFDTDKADKASNAFQIRQNDCMAQMSDERSEYLQSIGVE